MTKVHRLLLCTIYYLLFTMPVYAGTAGLYLTPASGNYTLGRTFSVGVFVVTGGEYINAVAANLSYPQNSLEVTGIDISGSFVTIWAEKSAGGGSVRLSGGLPTPGFNGEGQVATVNFKVLQPGQASVLFSEGTVVLRDSDNENILSSKFEADFSLSQPAPTLTSIPTLPVTPTPTLEPTILLPSPTPQVATPTLIKSTPTLIKEGGGLKEKEAERKLSLPSFFLGFALTSLLWVVVVGIYLLRKGVVRSGR